MTVLESMQPYGFDVGQSERGTVLKGLDLGVEGMRVGGQVSQFLMSYNFTHAQKIQLFLLYPVNNSFLLRTSQILFSLEEDRKNKFECSELRSTNLVTSATWIFAAATNSTT